MTRRAVTSLPLLAALAGCGTLDAPGHGDSELPNNRTGPFRVLTSADLDGSACVFGPVMDGIEDPSVLNGNHGEILIFGTRAGAVVRTVLDRSLRVTDPPREVLSDPAALSSPSVARTADGWVMAFARQGRIEVAHSADGLAWTVRRTPLLTQDPDAQEPGALGAPSLARAPDGRWTLAYTSGDAVWIARAASADGLYARLDGDPSTPRRDPALGGEERTADGGAALARRYADPEVTAERTGAGRAIWRLYARETARRDVDGGAADETVIALAASYDGARFTRATSPALSGRAEAAPAAPAVLFDGAVRTWMILTGSCGGSARGLRVAVAPGSSALPIGP